MEVRNEVLNRLKARNTTIDNFNFDTLWAPPLLSFLSVEDIEYFRKLATSIKYSAKIQFKYDEIDRIMKMRGFVKLGAGTNRVVYRYLENNKICIKIAIDAVGMKDNPREFKNQELFKPFVTKIFEVSPCGTVALVERVESIRSREEFLSIAGQVYDMLSKWFIGKYVLEDVGSKTWMNIGIRNGFGVVLLDFPYVYEIDGAKLYCSLLQDNGQICNGEIDYDEGLNYLRCTKCGARYKGIELQKAVENNSVVMKGRKEGSTMKVIAKRGNKIVKSLDSEKATKKVISKRERIYNSLPEIGDGLVVKVNYVKDGKVIEKEIGATKNESKSDLREIKQEAPKTKAPRKNSSKKLASKKVTKEEIKSKEPVKEEIKEEETKTNYEFDCDSSFIPSDIPVSTEETTVSEDPIKAVEDIEAIEEEVAEEVSEENVESDTPVEEESVEETTVSEDPIEAVEDIANIEEEKPKKSRKKSAKFDPDFYETK